MKTQSDNTTKPTKWKYSKEAFRKRTCERCDKLLGKEDAIICKTCYFELLAGEN